LSKFNLLLISLACG